MRACLVLLLLLAALVAPVRAAEEDDPIDVVELFCSICPSCCEVIDWWDGAWGAATVPADSPENRELE